MALKYQPRERCVLMCDFRGYEAPEIIKKRPVVVIARHRHNSKLVTVVPISSTQPNIITPYHYAFPSNPLPDKPHIACWAKCDLLATVNIERLDRYKPNNSERCVPVVTETDFVEIRKAVAYALRLS